MKPFKTTVDWECEMTHFSDWGVDCNFEIQHTVQDLNEDCKMKMHLHVHRADPVDVMKR